MMERASRLAPHLDCALVVGVDPERVGAAAVGAAGRVDAVELRVGEGVVLLLRGALPVENRALRD